MMRILFLSQVLPYPLDAGPKVRSYFVLRHLAQTHAVTLLCFVRPTDRAEHIAHLAEFCEAVHPIPMSRSRFRDIKFLGQSLATGHPFLILRDHVPAMVTKIQEMVASEPFDVIHADQLWMAQYALAAKATSPAARLILDQHNAVHLIPKRLAEGETNPVKRAVLVREARLLATYEAEICRHFNHVVWVTREDQQAVSALFGPGRQPPATVIPICTAPNQTQLIDQVSNGCRLTFLGGLHWPPNAQGVLWFAKQVFPRIQAEIPGAILTVIGKSPPPGLTGPGVEVAGYVVDLRPYLRETPVFIVPLHAGGGMRVKMLEAWSWGLPIVSTTIGAEGIDIEPGKNILIADTAESFAQAVLRLLREPALAQELRRRGRQTVIEKYNWQATYADWDKVYEQVRNDSRAT